MTNLIQIAIVATIVIVLGLALGHFLWRWIEHRHYTKAKENERITNVVNRYRSSL